MARSPPASICAETREKAVAGGAAQECARKLTRCLEYEEVELSNDVAENPMRGEGGAKGGGDSLGGGFVRRGESSQFDGIGFAKTTFRKDPVTGT